MDIHGPKEFEVPAPILPLDIAACKGIPRSLWNTMNVTLTNEAGMDVANGVCFGVDTDFVIDMDGQALGDDRFARLLRDVERPPKNSSQQVLIVKEWPSTLTKAILKGLKMCLDSLLPPPMDPITVESLPSILSLQLNNASRNKKNRWVFAICSLMVLKDIFCGIYINFLIIGHTHKDIDALFGRWSTMLKANNFSTIPTLMKSCMECETHPVILHFMEEVPDFKQYMEGYLRSCGDFLEGHSTSQQFKFYMCEQLPQREQKATPLIHRLVTVLFARVLWMVEPQD